MRTCLSMSPRRILLLTGLLALPLWGGAQTVIRGTVLEYHGKEPKTPLGGVEIFVQDASSTVSAGDGSFRLDFRTRKPGDPVTVRRIEKLDYEVFNKEALEQWNIGKSFTIVMCRKSLFKSLRDEYFRVSSATYAKQYRAEQEKLDRQRRENRLKQQEYERLLLELKVDYQTKLENLDTYAEYFARIDLGELAEEERQILALVQQGRIEEAIAAYERLDYLKRYQAQTASIRRLDSTLVVIDSVLQSRTAVRDRISSGILRDSLTTR